MCWRCWAVSNEIRQTAPRIGSKKQEEPIKKPPKVKDIWNPIKTHTTIMLSDSAATAITGAAFGASLAASGVYLPSVIIDQFRLTDFHMFHVFTAAMGSSA